MTGLGFNLQAINIVQRRSDNPLRKRSTPISLSSIGVFFFKIVTTAHVSGIKTDIAEALEMISKVLKSNSMIDSCLGLNHGQYGGQGLDASPIIPEDKLAPFSLAPINSNCLLPASSNP